MNHGKTRQINFYNIDNTFYFVDLPGFGYSKMSHVEQEKVGKFIEEYLNIRKNISLIILFIDIRHTPSENDILMYNYIKNSKTPFIILANKADKIAKTKVEFYIQEIKSYLNTNLVYPFSSENKIYSEEIWEIINQIIERDN